MTSRHLLVRFFALPAVVLLFAAAATTAPSHAQTASTVAAPDEPEHLGRWYRGIEADLVAEKFDELDRMANEYRLDKARVPGGDWKLHLFYEALDAPQLTDKDSADHLEHLQIWMKLRPESITARVALATSLHRWAWVARGNGTADKVTPEGWRLFAERTKEASVVLEGSRDMPHMCPQWFAQELSVGVADGWDARRMKDMFDRAVQFEPTFQYFYRQYANYLLPKWYGQPGDASAFAKRSADKLGGSAGDMLYFEIATVLVKRGDGDFPIHQLDWNRIQSGYRALAERYGANRHASNQLAFMAYKYRDTAVAQQQFASIGDEWSHGVWRDKKFFDRARDWAQGHTAWP